MLLNDEGQQDRRDLPRTARHRRRRTVILSFRNGEIRVLMTAPAPRVVSIHIGKIAPLGPENVPSGFVKQAVQGPVTVTPVGVAGDEQADLSVHGGPDKAVYGYGTANYAGWRLDYPQHSHLFVPGGVGENLAIEGMCEGDLCIGDIHAIGTARLQVCQPRQPCFKLALRFNDKHMLKAMVRSGRSGWYYRVLQAGSIQPGNPVELIERPNPNFPFTRIVELISFGKTTSAELEQMQNLPGLALKWQQRAREMLQRG
jgi:MOSC domain-containing protein YiiM